MMDTVPLPHTPRAHARHTNGIPCGCATELRGAMLCPLCAAAYDAMEVLSFVRWRCYDCSCGWRNVWTEGEK